MAAILSRPQSVKQILGHPGDGNTAKSEYVHLT